MKAYISFVSAILRACGVIAIRLVAATALVVCHMVFVRYFLNGSTVWQTEFVIYALVAATFIGSPFVLLEGGHVNVDLLPNAMTRPVRMLMNLGVGLAFAALLAWSGWIYFEEAWAYGWTTDTVWPPPLWIPLLPLPLGIGNSVPSIHRINPAPLHRPLPRSTTPMTPLAIGAMVPVALMALLAIGTPIAFALGFVSIIALMIVEGTGTLSILGETFFGGLASFGLISIPMFILMGAAVASSPAGKDPYLVLDRWLNRVPGGLVLSNLGACSIFAALSGSHLPPVRPSARWAFRK